MARVTTLLALSVTGLVLGCSAEERASQAFVRDVVPILEATCASSGCHGVTEGAEAAGEVIDWDLFFLDTDRRGRLTDLEAARATTLRTINTVEDPALSSLVRKPLDRAMGGLPHLGGDNFPSLDVAEAQAILAWIELEAEGGEDPIALDPLAQRYAETVQPTLLLRGCMSGNCHGADAAVPFRLDGGVRGTIGIEATHHNYLQARAMLALDGDPSQSRLIRKGLPPAAGGLAHKGGNGGFFPGRDAPEVRAIEDWACAEREAATGRGCGPEDSAPTGLVAVRGPIEPEQPFDLDRFVPGSDLWLVPLDGALSPGEPQNLTGSLHAEPADIGDPAVSPDGRAVAFAMRTSAARGHALWLLQLDSREARQLTEPGGPLPGGVATDRDPSWGADGRLWFVSTRQGESADAADTLDAELFALDLSSGVVERRSWTPQVERKPTWFTVGEEAGGELGFTALRSAVPAQRRAHSFRFPPGLQTEYHQHFGITPPETLHWDQRELPDGRFLSIVGELDSVWIGGRLGIVDRNFGPELPGDGPWEDIGLPRYAPPLARLDPTSASGGPTGRIWRDPAPLPDGRLLVAMAEGPLDLSAVDVTPRFGIELVTLAEDPRGLGPSIGGRRLLLSDPEQSWTDPEPVVHRGPLAIDPVRTWDPTATTAWLKHQGVPIIDGILANLPPSGPKLPRDDIAAVRVVEAVRVDPIASAAATRSGFGLSRSLGEVALEADGSVFLELPAGIAIRLQPIDARGMTVGVMHNRWFDFAPGQTISQGVPSSRPELYDARCAACHGSQSGDPDEAFPVADVLTTATLTLSRFEAGDPRRPRPPVALGAQTRRAVTWLEDVRPALGSCVACHGPGGAAGLDLTEEVDGFAGGYLSVLMPGATSSGGGAYLDLGEGKARASWIVERLLGEELDAPGLAGAPHPEDVGGAALDPATVDQLIRWIELGAAYAQAGP